MLYVHGKPTVTVRLIHTCMHSKQYSVENLEVIDYIQEQNFRIRPGICYHPGEKVLNYLLLNSIMSMVYCFK